MLLLPLVPINVMLPPPDVLRVPPLIEIPWAAPVVAFDEEVIEIGLLTPEEVKLAAQLNPMLPLPDPPLIELVATTDPPVEKSAPTLIPWPDPPVDPPPVQFVKVIVPVVPVVQAAGRETP